MTNKEPFVPKPKNNRREWTDIMVPDSNPLPKQRSRKRRNTLVKWVLTLLTLTVIVGLAYLAFPDMFPI